MYKQKIYMDVPTTSALEAELSSERDRCNRFRIIRNIIGILITIAAATVLVSTLILPILQIFGTSMTPTLESGDMVVALKKSSFERGDIIAFYYNNQVLVKRAIANAGEWVDIDKDGNVTVNGELLDEPYVVEKAFGECDIELPYQVPDHRIFVLGDHRTVSLDSRSVSIGCVDEEQVVGELVFRLWPLNRLGSIE